VISLHYFQHCFGHDRRIDHHPWSFCSFCVFRFALCFYCLEGRSRLEKCDRLIRFGKKFRILESLKLVYAFLSIFDAFRGVWRKLANGLRILLECIGHALELQKTLLGYNLKLIFLNPRWFQKDSDHFLIRPVVRVHLI
jgi:hypothetical protein